MTHEKFWLEKPVDLVTRLTILPSSSDTFEQKLNAVTRLVILITIILAIIGWKHWITFFVVCLIIIIALYLNQSGTAQAVHSSDLIENFNEDLHHFTYYGNVESSRTPNTPQDVKSQSETQVSANKLNPEYGNPQTTVGITFAEDIFNLLTINEQINAPVESLYSYIELEAVDVF